MNYISLKCPGCDADLEIENGIDTFYCRYCGKKVVVDGQSKDTLNAKVQAKRIAERGRIADRVIDLVSERTRKKDAYKAEKAKQETKQIKYALIALLGIFLIGLIAAIIGTVGSWNSADQEKDNTRHERKSAILTTTPAIDIDSDTIVNGLLQYSSDIQDITNDFSEVFSGATGELTGAFQELIAWDSGYTKGEFNNESIGNSSDIEKEECQLYIEISFEENAFFSRYNVELYLDDSFIATIPHGNYYTSMQTVQKGEHRLTFKEENGSNRSTADFNIKGDSTFSCKIKATSSNIKISNKQVTNTIAFAMISTPDLTGLLYSDAVKVLKQTGFANYSYETTNGKSIFDSDNWLVIDQSLLVKSEVPKSEPILLTCISLDDYFKAEYMNKNVNYITKHASENQFEIIYKDGSDSDISDEIKALDNEERKDWVVVKVRQYTGSKRTAVVTLEYQGMTPLPTETLLPFEETPEITPSISDDDWMQEEIDNSFQESAKKAIIVAFTNYSATDVFLEDGDTYDLNKLHGYDYSGEFKQIITKEGIWTKKDEKTWHVENLCLLMEAYNHATKVNCDITFEQDSYTLSNVEFITATSQYIDTEDPSKTSGWQSLNFEKNAAILSVSERMIDEKETCSNEINSTVAPSPTSSIPGGYNSWVDNQFSIWDGSHKELTKLIKKSLNDEKSYKHIKTTYYEIITESQVYMYNGVLEKYGYSDRLEMYDLLILVEFSAKNAFNATIKSSAIGIASYNKGTIKLIGID